MKTFAFIAFFVASFSSFAGYSVEKFSPHFSTNMPIVWQAETNRSPNSFWIYERLPPHPFSATVISNAVLLASLEHKISPEPSTNDFFYHEDMGPNYPSMIPDIFCITPKSATISFGLPHPGTNTSDIPPDSVLVRRAWACALKLGIDPAQVILKDMTTHFNHDTEGHDLTNQICGRGVFLSRLLDGIFFMGNGQSGGNDGFWIEFGSHCEIRAFSLVWPDLERDKLQETASPQQIIACIRAFKTITPPLQQEQNYFARVKHFAKAKKLTVTKITPYYGEGIYGDYGETQANGEPPRIIAPFAELKAVADFGNSNMTLRLFSPILSSDATRLLTK